MRRVGRYGAVGLAVLAFNMGLAAAAFRIPSLTTTPFARNLTNVLVTEVALLFAFFLHRRVTWQATRLNLLHSCVSFHLVSSLGLGLRFGLFYALDRAGVTPILATLASVLFAVVFNFFGYDRMVFRGANSTEL